MILTPTEIKILARVGSGERTTQEVAAELGMSHRRVMLYLQGIYRNLGVSNRVQALRVAQRMGLLGMEEPPATK